MEGLLKKFKIGLVAFGAMAFMLMAGWQFNIGGTEEVFSDKEVALENAFAGSASCKWKIISCGPFSGNYEACLVSGDGNSCSCGAVTRGC